MTGRIHDDEPDTGAEVVRRLLHAEVPEIAVLSLTALASSGSDNALYRLGPELVVRLPRSSSAAVSLEREVEWLPRLAGLGVTVPDVVHAGAAGEGYPYPWAVLRWIDGHDAWESRDRDWFGPALGHDLADVVRELRGRSVIGARHRMSGERGGPLLAIDDSVRGWLARADGLLDVRAVEQLWDRCREGAADVDPVLLHGDLIPGNILVSDGRLRAVIDWGGVGTGDPAQDLDPAWSVLDRDGAAAFAEAVDADGAAWLRAAGFALEQAIGGIVYYTPRRHPLADVMRRTLDRLLDEHLRLPR